MSDIGDKDTAYINSTDYKTLSLKLKELEAIGEDYKNRSNNSRKLRYAEVDIEGERGQNRLQPDELYIPQHIIDTNIRREQSAYIQYLTQSPRAVITENCNDLTTDMSVLDKDLTKRLRYEAWQLSQFANVDGFQANGYAAMEVILDLKKSGEIAHEAVEYGDFAILSDTRDIQAVEMLSRDYHYTRTQLIELCGDGSREEDWNRTQTDKVINGDPTSGWTSSYDDTDNGPRSLYCVKKVMFKVNGVVQVAWCSTTICDDWLRKPRPLYLGRRKLAEVPMQMNEVGQAINTDPSDADKLAYNLQLVSKGSVSHTQDDYETEFPYIIFPYLISENDTIAQLKGRVQLDQDIQEAVTSLLSSFCTQSRRAAGLYGSKDTSDPNDDILMQKNIFLRSGAIVNSAIKFFKLDSPDPSAISALNTVISLNQNETSQVNFAVNNRKDSRKTAEEVKTAQQQSMILSTVQVVLYSTALTELYTKMCKIIQTRVLAGLVKVSQQALQYYSIEFKVKPSGDTDVIEKQQQIQMMLQMWPIIGTSPLAQAFMIDLIEMMFPLNAQKYLAILQQAQVQAQSQQAHQQQQMMGVMVQMGKGIIELSKKPEFFSETGKIHALPIVESAAANLEQLQKQMTTPQNGTKPSPTHGQPIGQ